MTYEQIARNAGWKPMKKDIAELLGFVLSNSVTRFHYNSYNGDLSYSTSRKGQDAWEELCREEELNSQ